VIHVAADANALAWGWGGIPKYLDRILRHGLAGRGDLRITLLANRDAPFARIPGTREVVCRRRGGALWRNAFVSEWLARERPDVFWAVETLVPWRVPVPSVVTVHDVAGLTHERVKPGLERLAYRTSVGHGVRRARRVIAVSEATAADVRALWHPPAERLRVIGLGVDPQFTPGDRAGAEAAVRERFGIDGPFVLAVGSIEPRKGVDTLAALAAAARRRGAAWRVVLAGGVGYQGETLVRDALEAGARWLGRVDDDALVDLYRAADVLVSPARYEGFGLTPLEALACGTPAVIAAGSGGLVEHTGPVAEAVAGREGESWLAAVERARADREALGARGAAHAARYRWPAVAEATAAVLAEAAGRPLS
jgi:glycosyltransferase involved in cell wall biosynthesis